MAIQKTKTLQNGVTGNYWRIIVDSRNRVTGISTWTLALFKDQETSQEGKPHVGIIKYYRGVLTPEQLAGNRIQSAYLSIMAQAETMVTPPFGSLAPDQVPFDADLAGGVEV